MDYEKHMSLQPDSNCSMDIYTVFPGIDIAYNQIHTNSCAKADDAYYSHNMLIINLCIHGRCEATLSGNKCAIVKENQVCISTIPPSRDFYYPGSFYEGIQLYLNLPMIDMNDNDTFLSFLGIDINRLAKQFCYHTGLYIHQMSDSLSLLAQNIWAKREYMTMVF